MASSESSPLVDELGDAFSQVNLNKNADDIDTCVSSSIPEVDESLKVKESELLKELQSLQCPFVWKPLVYVGDDIFTKIKNKEEEVDSDEEETFEWRKFILNLVLSYEYFKCDDIIRALEKIRENEAIVLSFIPIGSLKKFYVSTQDALYHVVLASKAYIQFQSQEFDETRQILARIKKECDMTDHCKAALFGIHGACLMEYGQIGNKAALEYLEKAVNIDPGQAEWSFLLGKCLGRIRRFERHGDIPTKQELNALEKAATMEENSSYIIFLAQAYREAAFRTALRLRGESGRINIRCAFGFFKLPYPYQNKALAKKCIDKALTLLPDNLMALHYAGMIAERFENDRPKAKTYYLRSGERGNYGAYMDLFKMKQRESKNYDPISDLKMLLEKFKEGSRTLETLCQIGSYHLLVKNDLEKAFYYWKKAIEIDPEHSNLKEHTFMFARSSPMNIYTVLRDKARLALKRKTDFTKEQQDLFQEIIQLCDEKAPDSSIFK
uniref:Uncharacterized protein n=1 Tax=Timema cristinae TaxID=61476 RepID=A0A7R9H7G0_TIMCR|nr:unnamed protein product [Timema cristinae]